MRAALPLWSPVKSPHQLCLRSTRRSKPRLRRVPVCRVPTLAHRSEREAIAAFYASRDFAPLWFNGGTANAAVAPAIERLKHAADDGLDVNGFPQNFSPATDEEIASADLALSDAVVAYGRQASGSRVDPRMISRLIGVEPEVADPAAILARVATAGERRGRRIA